MIGSETLAVACGIGSALTWGAGDFSGGMATRKTPVLLVVLLSQLIGGPLLFAMAILFGEAIPSPGEMMQGAMAGICGSFGIVALYRGLAIGHVGVVAPLSSVMAALIPTGFAMVTVGLPERLQLAGIAVALAAVWLLSYPGGSRRICVSDLKFSLAAGLGFGLFFLLIDGATENVLFWPLVAARCASISLLFLLVFNGRGHGRISGAGQWAFVSLAGIFDALGNIFFALAAQAGRLDIAAVLTSLYPAATVMLAWLVLKEKIGPRQWIGVLVAVIAMGLFAA